MIGREVYTSPKRKSWNGSISEKPIVSPVKIGRLSVGMGSKKCSTKFCAGNTFNFFHNMFIQCVSPIIKFKVLQT